MVYAVIDTNILVSARISKNPLAATVKVVANVFQNRIIPVFNEEIQPVSIVQFEKCFSFYLPSKTLSATT